MSTTATAPKSRRVLLAEKVRDVVAPLIHTAVKNGLQCCNAHFNYYYTIGLETFFYYPDEYSRLDGEKAKRRYERAMAYLTRPGGEFEGLNYAVTLNDNREDFNKCWCRIRCSW